MFLPNSTVLECMKVEHRHTGRPGIPLLGLYSVDGKESSCQCRRHRVMGLIPGLRRFSGVGNGNPFQYSCLRNPMDRGAWWATVHGVEKNHG